MGIAASSLSFHPDFSTALREEETFYARYDWCLNPILALRQLWQRLHQELDGAAALAASWQRAEARINLYLFVCAIACTVDDYLSRRLADLSPISGHFPKLRPAVTLVARLIEGVDGVRSVTVDRSIALWRQRWERCVDAACQMLVDESDPGSRQWIELESRIRTLSAFGFPARLLRRRMLLPAAFRNQDLSHHDVSALARDVAAAHTLQARPLVVIGLRTAGAYFAPLLKAEMLARGVPVASCLTIRPKQGLSSWERGRLRRFRRVDAHLVVVDEPPDSGETLRLTFAILAQAGFSGDRITVAVPRSPAKRDWSVSAAPGGGRPLPRLVTLDPPNYHKARLLESVSIPAVLREYFGPTARVAANAKVDRLNTALHARHRDGFHVRMKRLFEVQASGPSGQRASTFVLAKSVGWGWLGYHAHIAGTRLSGLVPRVIGLRQGLLFTEWVGDVTADDTLTIRDIPVRTVAGYVAARARRLRMAEDPCFEDLRYGNTGWRQMVELLRRAYGRYISHLKVPALHERLRNCVSSAPALIDGRVRPEEWVANGTGALKADFEHHNFGKTELNIVDPAYDLAYATLAFRLSSEQERQLLDAYASESGDGAVSDRILLYKLLHGALVAADALGRASGDSSEARHEWNRRYLIARRFLTSQLSRFSATRIPTPVAVAWSRRVFFLDLDGVFDCEVFGFPHTTPSGLAALDLLRTQGFSVVLNTGRSVEEVHSYCRDYGLPGGLGEVGSVFVDAVAQREMALIDAAAAEQLTRCRDLLRRLPGVCVDPSYRYAVRAYRYVGECSVSLAPAEVEDVLRRAALDRLTCSPSSVDTIILQRGVDKGSGLTAARTYLGCADQPVAAIGDSDRDVPMLAAADFAFAPSGCSAAVRALGVQGRCNIMPAPMQRGLLRAARELARHRGTAAHRSAFAPTPRAAASDLLETLLHVAERSRLRQILGAPAWWSL